MMSEDVPNGPPDPEQPAAGRSESLAHHPATARVPERVARGAFASAVSVFSAPNEFVIDFFQGLGRPPQLVSRVVMTPATMAQFVAALRENLGRFSAAYGPPPAMPKPPPGQQQPSIQEVYQDLKIPDDQLSGAYANAVLIGHSPAEFSLDFITSFYPHAAVNARVYVAAARLPGVLETLNSALVNQQRQRGGPGGSGPGGFGGGSGPGGGPGGPSSPPRPGGPGTPGVPGLYPPTPPHPEQG